MSMYILAIYSGKRFAVPAENVEIISALNLVKTRFDCEFEKTVRGKTVSITGQITDLGQEARVLLNVPRFGYADNWLVSKVVALVDSNEDKQIIFDDEVYTIC